MRIYLLGFLVMFLSIAHAEEDPRAADRAALRTILDNMVTALNKQDFDLAAKNLHPSGIVTYYNAEVTVGHEKSREYFNRMLKQTKAIVKEYHLKGDVSAPAMFYGDTAVAYGTTEEHFKLTDGLEFALNGHWSTTIVKVAGEWKIVNLHFSANLFDNPLLNAATKMQWIVGVITFLAGLIIMFIFLKVMQKKSK